MIKIVILLSLILSSCATYKITTAYNLDFKYPKIAIIINNGIYISQQQIKVFKDIKTAFSVSKIFKTILVNSLNADLILNIKVAGNNYYQTTVDVFYLDKKIAKYYYKNNNIQNTIYQLLTDMQTDNIFNNVMQLKEKKIFKEELPMLII